MGDGQSDAYLFVIAVSGCSGTLAVGALLGEACVVVRQLSRGSHEGEYSYQEC